MGHPTTARTAAPATVLTSRKPPVLKLIYGVEHDPVVAEAGEGYWEPTPAPLDVPIDWLTDEAADNAPPKLRIFPNGRVAGVVAPAGRCLLDGSGECWIVPRPADGRGSRLSAPNTDDGDYYMAHVGETMTDQGLVATAVLAGPGGHANPYASAQQARRHYDDTDWQVARGRYVWSDKAGGLCFVGALWPWVDQRQIATIRASACSIDYRWIDDEQQHRLIATCLVNIGGLPSRYAALASAGFVLTDTRLADLAGAVGINPAELDARVAAAMPAGLDRDQARFDLLFDQVVARLAAIEPEDIERDEGGRFAPKGTGHPDSRPDDVGIMNQGRDGDVPVTTIPFVGDREVAAVWALADERIPDWKYDEQPSSVVSVPVDQIRATQPGLTPHTVVEYAERAARGETLRPPTALKVGDEYYIANGTHRTEALIDQGAQSVSMKVYDVGEWPGGSKPPAFPSPGPQAAVRLLGPAADVYGQACALVATWEQQQSHGARTADADSGLVAFARGELQRAGLLDADSDYDGMLGHAVLELVGVFAAQGHSGMSAAMTTAALDKVIRYEPLTPLTYAPDEWHHIAEATAGQPNLWQNRRKSSVFSEDGGATWYDIEEDGRPRHPGYAATEPLAVAAGAVPSAAMSRPRTAAIDPDEIERDAGGRFAPKGGGEAGGAGGSPEAKPYVDEQIFDRIHNDPDSEGSWGYLSERENLRPENREVADRVLLDQATDRGWSYEQTRDWVTSREGRYFGDAAATLPGKEHTVESLKIATNQFFDPPPARPRRAAADNPDPTRSSTMTTRPAKPPCTDCGEPTAHTAAYALEQIPTAESLTGPSASPMLNYGDQVSWASGTVGMYSDTMKMADGSEVLVVFAEEGGVLQMDDPLLLPLAEATQTGSMYSYVDPEALPLSSLVVRIGDTGETTVSPDELAEGSDDDTAVEEAPMMASAVASLPIGQRIAAGRVPQGSAVTPVEARLAATTEQHDTILAALLEGQQQITAQMASIAATVSTIEADRLAREAQRL